MIHPTAIIDPTANLGKDVSVGPWTWIGAEVEIGDNCKIANHVTIAGPTKLGIGNEIFPYVSLGQQSQDLKYNGEPTQLEIGDHNVFREFVTVNRPTTPGHTTRIGNNCFFLAYSHVAHDCIVGDHVIFSNNGTLAGHVEVGDYAIMGGLSGVHQFCRLGKHSMIGGCSKIVQDVPPFMIADGNPARIRAINSVGLKRRNFTESSIRSLKLAWKILYQSNQTIEQCLDDISGELAKTDDGQAHDCLDHLCAFIKSSSRGIIR